MYRLLRKKRGATLVVVIIVVTVLTVLSLVLVKAALNQLVLTNRDRHIDYTYYANHSAIDVCFKYISGLKDIGVTRLEPVDVSDADSVKAFADDIVNLIKTDATDGLPILNRDDGRGNRDGLIVDVLPDIMDKAKVVIKNVTNEGYTLDVSSGTIEILIGIEAESNFRNNDSSYSSGNKITYAEKKFVFNVPQPNDNRLEAAIYSVGDLYASSDSEYGNFTGLKAVVKGDVNVFGSYAGEIRVPEQYYFGGIYAVNQANLDIVGNAYTRSFIRTGPYLISAPPHNYDDSSTIRIYRDAIAQCIQGFGNNDKIVVYRNAYTFDDIELNGQNSIIAINGSAIGLTRQAEDASGTPFPANNHDSSSAIVNSAPLHNMLSEDSMKSRIIVNGDILLAGGTFKIDTDSGVTVAQIEDASLAWNNEYGLPSYKVFENWTDPNEYHRYLRDLFKDGNGGSFLNLFQLWKTVPNNRINDWLNNIDNVRDAGINDYSNLDASLKKAGLNASNNRDKLSGCWWYELSANDKLYCVYNPNITNQHDLESSLLYIDSVDGGYKIDNIYVNDNSNELKYKGDFWSNPVLSSLIDERFKNVKTDLLRKTHIYATREYPQSESQLSWDASVTNEFNVLLESLRNKCSANSTSEFVAHNDRTSTKLGGPVNKIDLNEFYNRIKGLNNLYSNCRASQNLGFDGDNKYYLIVNEDEDLSIVISGEFNGILVTAGTVILTDGAKVRGSIIAAGGGSWSGNVFTPRLNEISNNNEAERLDEGKYAAVKFLATEDGSANPTIEVDFYLGLDSFEQEDIIKQKAKDFYNRVDESTITLNKAARINLLYKFLKGDAKLNLLDIF